MIVLKLISLILWLFVIPFCMGLLPAVAVREKDRTPGTVFAFGYIVMFTLFELIGIPVVIAVVYHGFSWLSYLFMGISLLAAFLGVILTFRKSQKGYRLALWRLSDFTDLSLEEKAGFLLFLLLVGFQLYMAFTRASFDGDDAYYGVQGLIAQQQDTLYRINPNTGRSSPLDVRHALALIPVWEAFVGKMSGIHSTIIAHSVAPLVLIPLTYLVYFQIGKKLLSERKDMLPFFLILISLFQMFGNVSIYTSETFFLTRTWQGKSVAGNFIIPVVFWIFLNLFEKEEIKGEKAERLRTAGDKGYWILLGCLNLAAGVSSSLAVLLSMLLTAGLAFLFTIKERKFSILIKAGLTCIPGAAYVLTYLVISH
ncbi:MAG: DUF6077 domain-containing protein [Suilimivivens sp.]